jgi:FkbM family methyltransferase
MKSSSILPIVSAISTIDRLLDAVRRLRCRFLWVDRVCLVMARAAAGRMKKIRRGLGKGLLLDVGDGPVGYLIGDPEPDVNLALGALLGPGLTFYDIGANVGYYTLIGARLVGPAGRVIAFEPAPQNLARLRHNVALNHLGNVAVRVEALGDADGAASFALAADPTQNKLAAQTKASDRIVGRVGVNVRRLDGLIEAEKLPLPDFIKMDIEGGEVKALIGARETLRQSRPALVIELHDTAREVTSLLGELGYRIYTLMPRRELGALHIVALPKERADLRGRIAEFSAPFEL